MELAEQLRGWWNAARRGGPRVLFSVLDQGLMSGANFALNLLLARWLPLAEYGAFSVAFAIFLVLAGFHNALLLEPMSVLGVRYRGPLLPVYARSLLAIHGALTLALSVPVAVGSLVVPAGPLRSALLGLALTQPLLLLFWLARRALYLEGRSEWAALQSGLYAATLLGAAAYLRVAQGQSPLSAFLAMGFASALASAVGLGRLGVGPGVAPGGPPRISARSVMADHWAFARWMLATALVSLLTTQAQTFLVAGLLGLEGAGTLRALFNFMLPMAQTATAMGVLGVPALAADYQRQDLARVGRRATRISLGLAALAGCYEIGLLLLGSRVTQLVYGGRFADTAWLIPFVGLVPIFTALATGYAVELRAVERPDQTFLVAALTTPVALLSSFVLTRSGGVSGATLSIVLTYALSALLTYALCQRARAAAWEGRRPTMVGSDG